MLGVMNKLVMPRESASCERCGRPVRGSDLQIFREALSGWAHRAAQLRIESELAARGAIIPSANDLHRDTEPEAGDRV